MKEKIFSLSNLHHYSCFDELNYQSDTSSGSMAFTVRNSCSGLLFDSLNNTGNP